MYTFVDYNAFWHPPVRWEWRVAAQCAIGLPWGWQYINQSIGRKSNTDDILCFQEYQFSLEQKVIATTANSLNSHIRGHFHERAKPNAHLFLESCVGNACCAPGRICGAGVGGIRGLAEACIGIAHKSWVKTKSESNIHPILKYQFWNQLYKFWVHQHFNFRGKKHYHGANLFMKSPYTNYGGFRAILNSRDPAVSLKARLVEKTAGLESRSPANWDGTGHIVTSTCGDNSGGPMTMQNIKFQMFSSFFPVGGKICGWCRKKQSSKGIIYVDNSQ